MQKEAAWQRAPYYLFMLGETGLVHLLAFVWFLAKEAASNSDPYRVVRMWMVFTYETARAYARNIFFGSVIPLLVIAGTFLQRQ